ncbi:MAG: SDR family NAD(P)-dependent oxidoreductase [Dehalococcoidia bacterium]
MKLAGRVAIVTGSSRGIGKGMALGFAREGARVVVAARTETPQERLPGTIIQTAAEIEAMGEKALPIRCDVADEESVENMVQKAVGEWGRIDILVNNAASGSYLPFQETSLKLWDRVVAVNLRGTFLCTKLVLPHMIERVGGSIINISSVGAGSIFSQSVSKTRSEPTLMGIPYSVTKAGIERLSVGLAAEVGRHNIAVNALKPARPVLTEALKLFLPDADWSQWVSPEGMVRAAIFLAMQDARGVTGSVATDEELILRHGLGAEPE